MIRTLGLIAVLMSASAALAHDVKVGDLEFTHPRFVAAVSGAAAVPGYVAISNEGTTADQLIGVEVGFAGGAALHATDAAAMTAVAAIEIPAGDTTLLDDGGLHLMLTDLARDLAVGDMVPVTLIFAKGGRVEVPFMVDPASN